MKKIWLTYLLLAGLVACSDPEAGSATVSRPEPYTQENTEDGTVTQVGADTDTTDLAASPYNSIVARLADRLEHLVPARNPDLDFTRILELHLRTGQELADAEAARGRDTSLQQWAKRVSRERSKERKALSASAVGPAAETDRDAFYRQVMERINREPIPLAGELPGTEPFAWLMDRLGERTIYLAETYRSLGGSASLRQMARSLAASHKKEREKLRNWLKH